MKNNIKVIFSDLFGVLVGPDYSNLIKYISGVTGETNEKIYRYVFDETSMHFIRGEISFKQYFAGVQYKIRKGNAIDYKKFDYFWKQMKVGEMPAVNFLLDLNNKYKLYIITNTTNSHVKRISKKFNFINQFNGIITSNIAKAHKPNVTIFNYACVEANTNPHEAAFIDDSKENVEAAFNLGMTAHQYKTYAGFVDFIATI